jgi:hypothetical protein
MGFKQGTEALEAKSAERGTEHFLGKALNCQLFRNSTVNEQKVEIHQPYYT